LIRVKILLQNEAAIAALCGTRNNGSKELKVHFPVCSTDLVKADNIQRVEPSIQCPSKGVSTIKESTTGFEMHSLGSNAA